MNGILPMRPQLPRDVAQLQRGIRAYLPKKRYRQFRRAWMANNFVKGPARRKRVQRTHQFDPPALINVSLTTRCNLRCRGCYASSYSRALDMNASDFEEIIIQAKKLGTYLVGILGGEPLLRKDMFPVLERHRDVGFRISSNGTLVDDSVLSFLKRAGNVILFLSLEGFEHETDAWRGPGVFEAVLETMLRLKEERVLFGFSALLHTENRDALTSPSFLSLMEDLGNKFAVYFPYGPVGKTPLHDLVFEEQELDRTLRKLLDLSRDYSFLLKIEGYPSPPGSPHYLLNQVGCQAGRCVHITPEGNVEPCNGIQFYTANVFERPLAEILGSDFYGGVRETVRGEGKRCIAIFEPSAVLGTVERFGARQSHEKSLSCLQEHVRVHCGRTGCAARARKEGVERPC